MATTFKFGNGNWAVKEDYALAYNDENGNFKPLPFDFTRASTATRVNKNGLIETVGTDEPRIDFLNNTSGHLLLEPSRTNLVTHSEDFTQWTITGATVTSNTTTSPDGTVNADEVNITAPNAHYLFDTISVSASTNYIFTFYVKKGTATDVSYSILNATNFTNIVNTTSYFNEISDTEWTRISVEFTTPSGCTSIRTYPVRDGSSDGTIYIWGAQLEQGSYATSYIPTSGSTVTRSAETANGAGNSTVFNDSEGVLYVEMAALADDGTNRYISLSDGSTNNNIVIRIGSSNTVLSRLFRGGSPLGSAIIDSTTDTKIDMKVAIVYNDTSHSLFVNGNKVGTQSVDSSYTSGILTKVNFDAGNGTSDFYGTIKDLRVYDTTLSDSELQALTS